MHRRHKFVVVGMIIVARKEKKTDSPEEDAIKLVVVEKK